jgi:hypothetical protein
MGSLADDADDAEAAGGCFQNLSVNTGVKEEIFNLMSFFQRISM